MPAYYVIQALIFMGTTICKHAIPAIHPAFSVLVQLHRIALPAITRFLIWITHTHIASPAPLDTMVMISIKRVSLADPTVFTAIQKTHKNASSVISKNPIKIQVPSYAKAAQFLVLGITPHRFASIVMPLVLPAMTLVH